MTLDLSRLAVFPLYPLKDGHCTCHQGPECERAGKHPQLLWSELGPAEKWAGAEGCGYGVATGSRSGLFVVDLDIREDRNGVAAFMEMGDCPQTFTVRTPTGGAHLYFQLPDFLVKTSGNELAPGIDIRGEGGFVVAQDSPHKNGGTYQVALDVPIARAPQWLLDWPGLRGSVHVGRGESANAPIPVDVTSEEGLKRIDTAVEYLRKAPVAVEGSQGSTCLFRVCLQLVRTLELPLDTCMNLLDGFYNDRCQPPWSEQELLHKLEDARDRSDRMPGPVPPSWTDSLERAAAPTLVRPAFDNLPEPPTEIKVARRVKDPDHSYTFTPGVQPAASEMKKVVSSELAFIFSTNEQWRGVLQYDAFRHRVWAINPPLKMDAEGARGMSDRDIEHARMWLQVNEAAASKEDVLSAMVAAATRCEFHPITDYLESCRTKRQAGVLAKAATRIFNTTDEHADDFLKKVMIAAVRRAFQPGVQFDNMLVLYGPKEGEGKSTFCKILFGEPFTRSQMPDLASKDASQALQGYWGIEFAEMDRILKSENSTVKEFMTRCSDDFRPPYGRMEVHSPRSCVFIGTTNKPEFLRDAGRNRRYWPIHVSTIDLEWLRANRDAMWGEALALAESGEPHWYSPEDDHKTSAARENYMEQDPWHEKIEGFIKGKQKVTVGDVYEYCIARNAKDLTKYGRAEALRISDTLERLGCSRKKTNGLRAWSVPEHLSSQDPVQEAQEFANAIMANAKVT